MNFEKTYAIQAGPSPLSCDLYKVNSQNEYDLLLKSDPSEDEVQAFLERNPGFVPGARTPSGSSGHDPLHCALISQPHLPGLRARRPDFLWIACDSSTWFPTFIEIERPEKRLFTQAGVPSAHFTQARNQLAQWRAWLNDPANLAKFISEYGIGERLTQFRLMAAHYILIYGRRAEFDDSPELSRQRAALLSAPDEELISYDRLTPDPWLSDAITVHAAGFGRYRVKAVMPTITLGPNRADRLPHLTEMEEAIAGDERISEDRRRFLVSRVPYWRAWASRGGKGIVSTGDLE